MDEIKTMTTNPDGAGEKTFSQEDVNRIVSERLSKEKNKADSALVEREQQLTQRELLLTAKEKINEMGLPPELLDALNVSSKEALEKALTTVKTVFDAHKAEAQPVKMAGATPALSGGAIPKTEDAALRKAMGLPE